MIGARTVVHAAHEKRRLLVLMETVELRFHRFHSVTTATGIENRNNGRTSADWWRLAAAATKVLRPRLAAEYAPF